MTTDVQVIQPHDTLRRAATLMHELDIGALPVCDGSRLRGMLTAQTVREVSEPDGVSEARL